MKKLNKKIIALSSAFMVVFGLSTQAQNTVAGSGGEATGSGGTASYTVGQVCYTAASGSNGSVSEGVQQAYEVSITSVEDVPGITLNVEAYPNPTQGELWLNIEDLANQNLTYQVFDFNGKILVSEPVIDSKTRISLEEYARATYFLRVVNNNQNIKTFKIIKN